MKIGIILLGALLASTSVSFAQTDFTTQVLSAATNSEQMVTADFNGDKRPDLLLSGAYASVSVYLNDSGDHGPFSAPMGIDGSDGLFHVAVGDLNGDGTVDFVGCKATSTSAPYSFTVVSFLNNGAGSFHLGQVSSPQQGICQGLVVGDINRDGRADLVVSSVVPPAIVSAAAPGGRPVNLFQTWMGDGSGKFQAPTVQAQVNLDSTHTSNCAASDVIGGDFYADGNLNLVVNSQCSSGSGGAVGTTFVGRNYGDGKYTFSQVRENAEYLKTQLVSDIDKDGQLDLIVTGYDTSGTVGHLYYARNGGGGQFTFNNITSSINRDLTPAVFTAATLGAANGDGNTDLTVSFYTIDSQLNRLYYASILNGSGAGTFSESQDWVIGGSSLTNYGVLATDFNVDGKLDFIALNRSVWNETQHLYLYANAPGNNSCAIPARGIPSFLCQPGDGTTVSSPVIITAASNLAHFTLSRIYLDDVALLESTAEAVSTTATISAGRHSMVLVSYRDDGTSETARDSFTVGTGCTPFSPGVQICAPLAGTTQASPVTITAGAKANTGYITAIRAYVDDVAVATVNNTAYDAPFQASVAADVNVGSHRLVVVGYQSTGGAVTNQVDFTVVGDRSICYPSSAGARICSPTANATVTSPASVIAGATAASGFITAIRVYVDDVAQTLIYNPKQTPSFAASQTLSLAKGTHRLVVVGYQSNGGAVTAGSSVTVQ